MKTYLYAIGHPRGPIKIGISDHPERRLSEFQTSCPFPIHLLHAEPCETRAIAFSDEKFAHKFLKKHHLYGEWFNVDETTAVQAVQDTVEIGAHFRWREANGDFA